VAALTACASAPTPTAAPASAGPPLPCGNPLFHQEFEKELAAAQAEPDPALRAAAVCRVAHDWGIEDCSNVTPKSLQMP